MTPARLERLAQALVWAAVAAGLGARLAFSARDDGIFWPDEIYQSLEPAHRLVFGYGFQAWEFLEGARHWTLPGLVAGLFKACSVLGLSYPEQTLSVTRGFFCVLSAAVSWPVHRLARALGAAPLDAAVGAAASALMAVGIYFAPRAMGETASALPLVLGLALAFEPSPRRTRRLWGPLLLCVAVFLRLQNALVCVAVLGVWAARRDKDLLKDALVVFVAGGALYGLVDAFTWGEPFQSFRVYVRYNLLEGKASLYGTESPLFYVKALLLSEGRLVLPLAVLGALAFRQARALWAVWLTFFLVHSALPHKELRFIYVLLPLLGALGAVGLTQVRTRWPRWHGMTALAVTTLAVVSAAQLGDLTFGRLGVRNPGPPTLSALDYSGPENRLLRLAGHRDDVCGLRVLSTEHWRTGGYSSFHRQVPLYGLTQRTGSEQSYNFTLVRGAPAEGEVVARDGEVALVKLSRAGCAPDPDHDWHLE